MFKDKAKRRWFQYQLKSRRRDLKYCSLEEFRKFWETPHVCSYCGIPDEKIKDVYPNLRILTMTVDRKDNDRGYEIDNICWACLPCNMIKSFHLNEKEMKEIGERYMRKKWENEN